MTQSHHMTSQKIASADPGDALNLRKLAEAENRKETICLNTNILLFDNIQTAQFAIQFLVLTQQSSQIITLNQMMYHNLRKLSGRPAKFEKPRHFTMLRVIF